MSYEVWCSVDGCPFERRTIDDINTVFDMHRDHQDQRGVHHVLNFERIEE